VTDNNKTPIDGLNDLPESLREYIGELRVDAKKTKVALAKAIEEAKASKAEAEELKKLKDIADRYAEVRTMDRKSYQKTKTEFLRNQGKEQAIERERRQLETFTAGVVKGNDGAGVPSEPLDVRKLSREEYLKAKRSMRIR
jgi:hypothetical protein